MVLTLGWIATALYLLAHAYLSVARRVAYRAYYGVNLVAALAFVASSAALSSWQSVAINAFWAATSIAALLRMTIDVPVRAQSAMKGLVAASAFAALPCAAVSVGLGAAVLGWSGALLYCVAYFFLADEVIGRRTFLLWNVAAAAFLIPAYWLQANWPALGMSVSWIIVSGIGLLSRRSSTSEAFRSAP